MGEYCLRVMVCDRCGAKQEVREEKGEKLKGWDVAHLVRTGARDAFGVQEEYQYRQEVVLCPRC